MLRCLALFVLCIGRVCHASGTKSKQQIVGSSIWQGWTQPEVTLETLHIAPESIILLSPEVDTNAEHAATLGIPISAPLPLNVVKMPDLPDDIEKLRSELEKVLQFTRKRQLEEEKFITPHGGTVAKPPMASHPLEGGRITPLNSVYYQKPTVYLVTLLFYFMMVPVSCQLLGGGRTLVHQHIPAMTTFATYFIAWHIGTSVFGVNLIAMIFCVLAAYGGKRISMKPLKWLRLGPSSIRKEPIGWIFEIICVCGIMANVIYRTLLFLVSALLGLTHLPLWVSAFIHIWYRLHMVVVSACILAAMVKLMPTYFAQELVFAFSSLYIILSGLSYANDILVYNSIIGTGLVSLDPTVFFVPEPRYYWSSSLYLTALCIASFYTSLISAEKVYSVTHTPQA